MALPTLQNSRIASLHTYLRTIRQAYLSTAPPRKSHLLSSSASKQQQQPQHLTDQDKEQVDASAKQMLRELHGSVRVLADAERLRRDTEAAQIRRKYAGRLGALGAWAAGSDGGVGGIIGGRRSPEHAAAEEAAAALAAHREGVLWFLRTRLGAAADTQRAMMDVRLTREIERNRSVLAKARGGGGVGPGTGPMLPGMPSSGPTAAGSGGSNGGSRAAGGVLGGGGAGFVGLPPGEGDG